MTELMAPAGSLEGARIALKNGADSVYAGVSHLSLRPRRVEFRDGFKQLVDFVHQEGKKIYAVVNVFLKPEDINNFEHQMEKVYQSGADGVMVADIGVLEYIHQKYPNLPIHISVQNSVTNPEAAKFYQELGASVIVISRSVGDFDEIEKITKSADVDWEVFIHGGICYHYDGNCFLSSYWRQEKVFDEYLGVERILGQNNTKGECHLICKRNCTLWENNHQIFQGRLLRRPDLVGLADLPKYIEMGIKIFKIEGRAMPLKYVGQATNLYRKAIDLYLSNPQKYSFQKEWLLELKDILAARLEYERRWDIK